MTTRPGHATSCLVPFPHTPNDRAHTDTQGMGGSYHHPEPGWLRVTFSLDRPTLELALQRLARALDLQ